MPLPTPFHAKTHPLCESLLYKDWGGYHAVCAYRSPSDREYQAFRHSAGVIDVSPLQKYEVTGKDAAAFLSRVTVRNIEKLRTGRVTYTCWTDDHGKVLDDGTITRWKDDHFRVTSNSPSLRWFQSCARGYEVKVEDSTDRIGVLAVQGPESKNILRTAADMDVDQLRFFRADTGTIQGIPVEVTRTGYTGDLGYEVWTPKENAEAVWDAIFKAGEPHGIEPCGLNAMDITRIEAGFMLHGIDYFAANTCLIEDQKSTPHEIGLGWSVQLKRAPFIGHDAIRAEKKSGVKRLLVGLDIDWNDIERLFDSIGLPPHLPVSAWRDPVPVYRDGKQVGQATSGVWSPLLKKNLALATVNAPHYGEGTELEIEITVEFERMRARATIVPKPFFDPERKKA